MGRGQLGYSRGRAAISVGGGRAGYRVRGRWLELDGAPKAAAPRESIELKRSASQTRRNAGRTSKSRCNGRLHRRSSSRRYVTPDRTPRAGVVSRGGRRGGARQDKVEDLPSGYRASADRPVTRVGGFRPCPRRRRRDRSVTRPNKGGFTRSTPPTGSSRRLGCGVRSRSRGRSRCAHRTGERGGAGLRGLRRGTPSLSPRHRRADGGDAVQLGPHRPVGFDHRVRVRPAGALPWAEVRGPLRICRPESDRSTVRFRSAATPRPRPDRAPPTAAPQRHHDDEAVDGRRDKGMRIHYHDGRPCILLSAFIIDTGDVPDAVELR